MLWSAAICDLLFKLQNLVDIYGDSKAKDILAEVGKLQQENERSPIWETKLFESVAELTQLLDIAELSNSGAPDERLDAFELNAQSAGRGGLTCMHAWEEISNNGTLDILDAMCVKNFTADEMSLTGVVRFRDFSL